MRIHLSQRFCLGLMMVTLIWAQNAFSQSDKGGEAPAIKVQPSSQKADHGANILFSVEAFGDNLEFQWRKNESDIADYGNVSGASTATLKLESA